MADTIYIISGFLIVLLSGGLSYLYFMAHRKQNKKFKLFFRPEYHRKYLIAAIVITLLAAVTFAYSMFYMQQGFLKALVNAEMMLWLAIVSLIDYREKIIPNSMILAGIAAWVIFFAVEVIFAKTPVKQLLAYSLGAALLCGGVLFVVALVVKTALGMGDVKMVAVISLFYGLMNTYSIVLVSMVIMFIVSIILLILKKADRKTAIPMAPFVLAGFFVNIFFGV